MMQQAYRAAFGCRWEFNTAGIRRQSPEPMHKMRHYDKKLQQTQTNTLQPYSVGLWPWSQPLPAGCHWTTAVAALDSVLWQPEQAGFHVAQWAAGKKALYS